jgi:hypothetical protein
MQIIGNNTTALSCAFPDKERGCAAATSQCATSHCCGFGAALLQHGIKATPNMTGAPGSDLAASDHHVVQQRKRVTISPRSAVARSRAPGEQHHFCGFSAHHNALQPLIPRTQRMRLPLKHVAVHVMAHQRPGLFAARLMTDDRSNQIE